jgi:hypothetical protein
MRKIAVESIENDMMLGRDITSTSGNTLLGKGTKLSSALGRRLKNWGISFVYIEGEEESLQKEHVVVVSPEEVRAGLINKFAGHENDPLMQKLFTAVYEFMLNRKRNQD